LRARGPASSVEELRAGRDRATAVKILALRNLR
jgi:hypothetical protein